MIVIFGKPIGHEIDKKYYYKKKKSYRSGRQSIKDLHMGKRKGVENDGEERQMFLSTLARKWEKHTSNRWAFSLLGHMLAQIAPTNHLVNLRRLHSA